MLPLKLFDIEHPVFGSGQWMNGLVSVFTCSGKTSIHIIRYIPNMERPRNPSYHLDVLIHLYVGTS